MDARVRYPRLLAVFRTLLYLAVTVALLGLVGATVAFLGFLVLLTLASALVVGEVRELAVFLAGGVGLLVFGSVGVLLVVATRHVDRRVVRAARIPTPLERVTTSYVRGDIDERELERGLERVLVLDSMDGAPRDEVTPASTPRRRLVSRRRRGSEPDDQPE